MTDSLVVHQFHYAASPADAVTEHMRFIRDSLKAQGIGGDVFARRRRSERTRTGPPGQVDTPVRPIHLGRGGHPLCGCPILPS